MDELRGDPGDRLLELGELVFTAWALQVVATIGVADHMADEPRPVVDLAAATGVDADALRRTLRLLATHGIVTEPRPGDFALTAMGRILRSDAEGSLRSWFVMGGPINRAMFEAPLESLRTGAPAFDRVMGAPFFEYATVDPAWGAVFDDAMRDVGRRTALAVAEAVDLADARQFVDVGGGTGTLAVALLAANPTLVGIVFDLPAVADRARSALAAAGVQGRATVTSGSFFDGVPAGADVYVLSWIIHDWDDDRAVVILEHCRRAMTDRGRVLLVEYAMPEDDRPHLAKSMDVAMLVAMGGRERTEAEYGALLGRAGLRLERVIPTTAEVSVFEARAAG